jgi:alkylhydroperoxidase/carboxymuconolactone decarboxylase family protein YurZ
MMKPGPRPPKTYEAFLKRYPKIAAAWELIGESGQEGPLDARTVRLVKLATAMGALREGAVRAGVRKALVEGISPAEIEQVIALAAGSIGFPATVAIFSWTRDMMARTGKRK